MEGTGATATVVAEAGAAVETAGARASVVVAEAAGTGVGAFAPREKALVVATADEVEGTGAAPNERGAEA